jgi:quercetin dioxygenase-like cupin family protein
MPTMNRRDLCLTAGAFAALGGLLAQAQEVHGEGSGPAMDTSKSRVFHFDQMPVRNYANGGWGRTVMHGTLPTGEFVEVHETMLPAGQMPHPPHKHRNTEFVLIREGKLEFYNNGSPEPCGPGDIVYTASNQMHGMKNVGTTPAMYFVVSISHGQM